MQLSDYIDVVSSALGHKAGLTITAAVTTIVSTTIPYYQEIWFSFGEHTVTGMEVSWTIATFIMTPIVIFKIAVEGYKGYLEVKKLKQAEDEAE